MKIRSPSLKLPSAIATYWTEANAGRCAAAAACFAPDAVVRDEGESHAGPAAILGWIEATRKKYHPKVEPLRAKAKGDRQIVTAKISGTFPGSPIELDYEFTLQKGKILSLQVL